MPGECGSERPAPAGKFERSPCSRSQVNGLLRRASDLFIDCLEARGVRYAGSGTVDHPLARRVRLILNRAL